jgi:Ras-related protein Rab-6A
VFIECSAKAGYNVKSLFKKLASSLPGSIDAPAGGAGSAAAAAGGANPGLIDIKLSAAPANLDEAAGGCGAC